MAQSPVVITSSSPPPFRLPSETPPPAQALLNANIATNPSESSSSPGLPSPSSFFVKKSAAGLQVNSGNATGGIKTTTGFQRASSLLKESFVEETAEGKSDHVGTNRNTATRPATAAEPPKEVSKAGKSTDGKLEARATIANEQPSGLATSLLHTFACRGISAEPHASRTPAPRSPLVCEHAPRQAGTKSRTPSISLSVCSFDDGLESDARTLPVMRPVPEAGSRAGQQQIAEAGPAPTLPVNKARKQVVQTANGNDGQLSKPAKKRAPKSKVGDQLKKGARKPVAKSASFVLNSDDLASTQFAGMDAAEVQGSRSPLLDTFRHDSATVEKAKRAPRKSKKVVDGKAVQKASRPEKHKHPMTDESSAYFNKPAVFGDDSAIDMSTTVDVGALEETASATPVHARQRRRSWTPARNTTLSVDPNLENTAAKSDDDEAPVMSLAAVLGNFTYDKQDVTVPARAASGEGLPKRRRIELAEEATGRLEVKKKVSESGSAITVEKVKKPKAAKKKPQTITELATKAYRPDHVPQAAQATVSSFFAAQTTGKDEAHLIVPPDGTIVKVKKPRKPREKKVGDEARSEKPKKVAKPKPKAKVRFNEDDLFGQLYTPEQARLHEGRQEFLFGTSSQLGAEESPTFIRQMQLAVRESEATSATQHTSTPSRKSCVSVPTAPHGTSLSCGQAMRGLWCSAARDDHNGVLAVEHGPPPQIMAAGILPESKDVAVESRAYEKQVGVTADQECGIHCVPMPLDRQQTPSEVVHDIVDLCYTSPIAGQAQDGTSDAKPLQNDVNDMPLPARTAAPPSHDTRPFSPTIEARSDDWAILGDSSPEVPLSRRRLPQAPVTKPHPQLKRCATSPVRDRSALRALDANVSPQVRTSPHKAILHARYVSTSTAQVRNKLHEPSAPTASTVADTVSKSPKRRGRPPKQRTAPDSRSPVVSHLTSPSKLFSASQPVTSSDFVNIDEISDTEPALTPSPPRRRATSTPPSLRPLEFEVVASPSVKAQSKAKKTELNDTTHPSSACSKLKPDDTTWVSVMPTLFSQITATIKSTAPSTDLARPTWYEKILLYDPIVLEDLTTWLNERGVRVESKKLKSKAKVKARKKKKDVHESGAVEDTAVSDEYETVQELLKPWMVQKWCEDKSACCLWKEGLRGGVRTRY